MGSAVMSETVIPYTADERPDTGFDNVHLGLWLFLASEVMLFGALLSGYILLRFGSAEWPRGADYGLSVSLATVNTLILLVSSVTIVLARKALERGALERFRLHMGVTILAGLGFLAIKGFEYWSKFDQQLYPSTDNFLALYFTLTGIHVLHVVGGLAVHGYLWGPGLALWHARPRQCVNRVAAAGLYWHFVDLVWIVLFVVFYWL